MAQEAVEFIETPDSCEVTTEYDNRIENDIEIEPDSEEPEDMESYHKREEIEQKFARYERNYRARRIREITIAPVKRKRGRPSKIAA